MGRKVEEMKQFVREVNQYANLYRDDKTGIAWIEDGSTGLRHSCHPNTNKSGSIIGMKQRGYWDKSDRVFQSHGWKYNISRLVVDEKDELDLIVADECMCQACIERRKTS